MHSMQCAYILEHVLQLSRISVNHGLTDYYNRCIFNRCMRYYSRNVGKDERKLYSAKLDACKYQIQSWIPGIYTFFRA